MQHTKEIITPVDKHKVVIKTMLSGAERESVENAQMDFVQTTDGSNFTITDMKKVTLAEKHALLTLSVASIDGDPTDVLARLQKMLEPDYAYVHSQVLAEQKKMTESISPASS